MKNGWSSAQYEILLGCIRPVFSELSNYRYLNVLKYFLLNIDVFITTISEVLECNGVFFLILLVHTRLLISVVYSVNNLYIL